MDVTILDYMDILLRVYPDRMVLNFRSIGNKASDVLTKTNLDEEVMPDFQESLKIMKGMARSVDSNYIMGMNNTRITLDINSAIPK